MGEDPVPQDVYTRDYFLTKRHGADEFAASAGAMLSPIHETILALADPRPGRKILDVGCGCGELVIHAARRGAEAVGVDYAEAAHQLAIETAARQGVSPRFYLCDVSEIPESSFDAVILADVVEHLHDWQLGRLYADIHARLNPGGRIVVHTWPNRLHTEYAYPIARQILRLAGVRKPRSPRKPHDEVMHVNEQSVFSLRRDLRRAGFRARVWQEHPAPAEAGRFYRFVHEAPLLRIFFADHLFAVGTRE